ncbi:hypothetical protein BDZ89DRAFT_1074603 [Hymenopellis radicata]|nr:hypothetical protein BDZ89DRAFT_1074603 [Hymenopellis radicata]
MPSSTMNLLSLLSAHLFISLASAATYTVGVGKDEVTGHKGIGFDPSAIFPLAGDTIVFEFRSGSHSVVATSFDKPCAPSNGFDSGVVTVADSVDVDASGLPTVSLMVNNTDSIWLSDRASGECNQGAVLAVNPTGTQTAAQFKANALSASPTSEDPDPSPASSSSSSSMSESSASSVSSPTPTSTDNVGTKHAIQTTSTFAVVFGILLGLL